MTNLEALQALHHTQRALLDITQNLDVLELKEREMPIDTTVQNVINALDTATTNVATRIQALIDNPPNSTAELVAALQPEVDKLSALGTQPTPAAVVANAGTV